MSNKVRVQEGTRDAHGMLDEMWVFSNDQVIVHLERMDWNWFWMGVFDHTSDKMWHVRIYAPAVMDVAVEEDEDDPEPIRLFHSKPPYNPDKRFRQSLTWDHGRRALLGWPEDKVLLYESELWDITHTLNKALAALQKRAHFAKVFIPTYCRIAEPSNRDNQAAYTIPGES